MYEWIEVKKVFYSGKSHRITLSKRVCKHLGLGHHERVIITFLPNGRATLRRYPLLKEIRKGYKVPIDLETQHYLRLTHSGVYTKADLNTLDLKRLGVKKGDLLALLPLPKGELLIAKIETNLSQIISDVKEQIEAISKSSTAS